MFRFFGLGRFWFYIPTERGFLPRRRPPPLQLLQQNAFLLSPWQHHQHTSLSNFRYFPNFYKFVYKSLLNIWPFKSTIDVDLFCVHCPLSSFCKVKRLNPYDVICRRPLSHFAKSLFETFFWPSVFIMFLLRSSFWSTSVQFTHTFFVSLPSWTWPSSSPSCSTACRTTQPWPRPWWRRNWFASDKQSTVKFSKMLSPGLSYSRPSALIWSDIW